MSHPHERDLALRAGGDLPAGAAARIEEHLAGCPDCRALAEGLRASRAAVEALAAEPLDDTALARVRHGLRRRLAEEEARAVRRRRSATVYLVGALAAALVAAAVGLGIWYRAGSDPEPGRLARAERPERPEADRGVPTPPSPERPEALPERDRPEAPPVPGEGPGRQPRGADREPRGAPPPPEPGTPSTPPPDPHERRAEPVPAPAGPTESMVIKVVSDDPNVVYYWLVEPEETQDETVTS
ncbi:MAG TPA: zf-HC2 domain-containing protein [Thermoanaerobaculia bacterium]|nr:zf-HC2 domain-containing protein [Thermoanaerobaculia bacterium]